MGAAALTALILLVGLLAKGLPKFPPIAERDRDLAPLVEVDGHVPAGRWQA